jgi:hypothetical protein
LYAIEDWGTGYWDDFPDGKRFTLTTPLLSQVQSLLPLSVGNGLKVPFPCHSYGMVGFVKELVDEQGAANIALGLKASGRVSKFKHILVTPSIVFVTKAASSLSASPNPVPAGKGVGKTMISWRTADRAPGKVYVSKNGGEESLLAVGSESSASADWIANGSSYEFRLYTSDHVKLLARVVVTRATQ